MTGRTVGVFGTWRAPENSTIYEAAVGIGRIAARRGFVVLTGGYSGVMEAAARGAQQEGGHSVGYTWSKLDKELAPNPYLSRTVTFACPEQRIAHLVADADICVFFPGRNGTVAELALAVELRSKNEKAAPIVLVGDFWGEFFAWLRRSNDCLEFGADSSAPRLAVTVADVTDFDRYLADYEDHRHQ